MEPPGCVIKNDLQLNLHGDSKFFGMSLVAVPGFGFMPEESHNRIETSYQVEYCDYNLTQY